MHTILNPNMELITKRQRKGIEKSPLNAESFGRNCRGPDRKNFVIPKEEDKKLNIKVRRGKAELKSLYFAIVSPNPSLGKKPSVLNNIASDMFT